jgi:hypothetical protein
MILVGCGFGAWSGAAAGGYWWQGPRRQRKRVVAHVLMTTLRTLRDIGLSAY